MTIAEITGKERDPESQLDYFGARYYGSALGRFTTPDWSASPQAVPYTKLENPQSLNLYSYVLNNPLSTVDKDGHACSALLGNSGSGFCQRAAEYANNIDANSKVRSQTRFFAAASAVSQALADLATLVEAMLGMPAAEAERQFRDFAKLLSHGDPAYTLLAVANEYAS